MTRYARFDHTVIGVTPVTGWFDTGYVTYTVMPNPADLLTLTDDQWTAGPLSNPNGWAVSGGTVLIPVAPPQASPLALARAAMAQRLTLGIAITSDSTPAVNAIYALDQTSTDQIFQIGLYAKQFGSFPGGLDTQYYPDITGLPHPFPVPVFVSFLQAVAALIAALNQQMGVMAQGGSPAWPAPVADIQ